MMPWAFADTLRPIATAAVANPVSHVLCVAIVLSYTFVVRAGTAEPTGSPGHTKSPAAKLPLFFVLFGQGACLPTKKPPMDTDFGSFSEPLQLRAPRIIDLVSTIPRPARDSTVI
jgi:hypothetical protein